MSSAWEGMPIALLEAAAAGLPIVATLVGGNHEVVLDEESGALVPPRDHDALAAAMLRLMEGSDERRRAMGRRGREHIRDHYGLDRVVERWEELYREVLLRKGSRRPLATDQDPGSPSPSPHLSGEEASGTAGGQR
jgi:glycosyltransferase involved in cell wall biosynthesis